MHETALASNETRDDDDNNDDDEDSDVQMATRRIRLAFQQSVSQSSVTAHALTEQRRLTLLTARV